MVSDTWQTGEQNERCDDRELMSRNKWFTLLNITHRILSTQPLVWANCPKRCIHTIHFLLVTTVRPLPVTYVEMFVEAANSRLTPESTITVYCLTRLVISPKVLVFLIFPSSSSNRLPSQGCRGCYTTRHLKLLSFCIWLVSSLQNADMAWKISACPWLGLRRVWMGCDVPVMLEQKTSCPQSGCWWD